MSMGFRADPTGNSGVISVAGADQVVITNASNVVATTFTGALAGNADTATKFGTTTGVAPVYGCRAWVSFDATRDTSGAASGANTPRFIRGSGNVSVVDKMSAGDYIITFQIPMPDIFYSVNYSNVGPVTSSNHNVPYISSSSVRALYTETQVAVCSHNVGSSNQRADGEYNSVIVFR
jgi:hypothetical protein